MTSSQLFTLVLLFLATQSYGNIFIKEPKNQLIPLQSKAEIMFSCKVALTSPTYSWRKDGTNITLGDNSRISAYGGELIISSPQSSDAGKYQCIAQSDEGVVASNYGNLKFAYINNFVVQATKSISVNEGEGVSIPCTGADYGPEKTVSFYWEVGDGPRFITYPFDSSHYVSQKTGTLYIANPTSADGDDWSCSVRSLWKFNNAPVTKTSPPVRLYVTPLDAKRSPEFLLRPNNLTATRGKVALFECFASGKPTPTITWTRAGGKLPNNSQVTQAKQLLLTNVTKETEGEYTCTASNSEGSVTSSAFLNLQYKPQWTNPISSTSADLTGSVTLRCGAIAVPAPTFIWLKNAQTLEISDRIMITEDNEESRLMLMDATEKDEAMYQCIATNSHGSIFSSAKLTIRYFEPEFKESVPSLTKAAVGREAKIICVVDSAPPAQISWKKDNVDLNDDSRHSVEPTGSLVIQDILKSDEGEYACQAKNSLGTIESAGHLKVYDATIIITKPVDLNEVVGNSGELFCEATYDHDLALTWQWFQDDKKVVERNHYELSGASLLLMGITSEQSGIYKCCAKTQIEEVCASATVQVMGPPDSPTDVKVGFSNSTTQEVLWEVPKSNGDVIARYVVEGKNSLLPGWFHVTVANSNSAGVVTDNHCQVTGLLPHNQYSYRVSAVNSHGAGKTSEESAPVYTDSAAPTVAPTGLRSGKSEPGKLVVEWDTFSPTLYGSTYVTYVVAVRKYVEPSGTMSVAEKDGRSWEEKPVIGSTENLASFEVDASEIFVPYEAKIRASNTEGESPFSNVTIVHTAESAPTTAPSGFWKEGALAYSLDIAWEPLKDTRGFTKGYLVRLCDITEDDKCVNNKLWINGTTKDSTPNIHIEGLEANKLYKVSAAGWNTGGVGPFSDWDSKYMFSTEKPPPDEAPQNVKISVLDLTLSAKWDPVVWEGGEIEGYKVQYWLYNETALDAQSYPTAGTQVSFQLPAKSEYNVRVVAYNAGGNGRPSATSSVSTQKGVQGRYEGDHASSLTASVTLIFSIATLWSVLHSL